MVVGDHERWVGGLGGQLLARQPSRASGKYRLTLGVPRTTLAKLPIKFSCSCINSLSWPCRVCRRPQPAGQPAGPGRAEVKG